MGSKTVNKNIYLQISSIILVVNGLLYVLRGIFLEIMGNFGNSFTNRTGVDWDNFLATNPEIAQFIIFSRLLFGVFQVMYGILLIGIVWKFFRNGERWAWYVMWLFPITWISFFFSFYLSYPSFYQSFFDVLFDFDIMATVAISLAILLPFRVFFQKNTETG